MITVDTDKSPFLESITLPEWIFFDIGLFHALMRTVGKRFYLTASARASPPTTQWMMKLSMRHRHWIMLELIFDLDSPAKHRTWLLADCLTDFFFFFHFFDFLMAVNSRLVQTSNLSHLSPVALFCSPCLVQVTTSSCTKHWCYSISLWSTPILLGRPNTCSVIATDHVRSMIRPDHARHLSIIAMPIIGSRFRWSQQSQTMRPRHRERLSQEFFSTRTDCKIKRLDRQARLYGHHGTSHEFSSHVQGWYPLSALLLLVNVPFLATADRKATLCIFPSISSL